MVSVRAFWKSTGKPASNVKIGISFQSGYEYTNSSGEVHFDVRPHKGKIYLDGVVVYEGYLEGMMTVYVDY